MEFKQNDRPEMTLKEIKAMFITDEVWSADHNQFESARGLRTVHQVRSADVIWEKENIANGKIEKFYMDLPRKQNIIEARAGFLKFHYPERGIVVTLTKKA